MSTMGEVEQRLFQRRRFGIKLGLELELAMLERLGNPQREYPVIHVAGTNGKGSVCAMLQAILSAAGVTTGLYTSPHLVSFNERFQVDRAQISDADLEALATRIEAVAESAAADLERDVTFFECSTAIAFEYFRQQAVQMAVIETGLGGRLDATNVVAPLVSVITPVSLEHTEHLGDTLEAVAAEKAGIIKAGRPVVMARMDEAAADVIRRTCRERGCRCIDVAEQASMRISKRSLVGQKVHLETSSASYGTVNLSLLGDFQAENLATAAVVIDVLRDQYGIPIDESMVATGVRAATWPGRCQLLTEDPPTLLDGAHNPAAALALATVLQGHAEGRPLGMVIGMCGDKDIGEFLRPFARLAPRLWVVPIDNERNTDPERILAPARAMGWTASATTLQGGLDEARAWGGEAGGMLCITGSLFLVGEVLAAGQRL